MAGQGKCWGNRCRNSRGAVAVEFALVLPLLGMLVFGIVSFGLAFSDKVALANAIREGSRFGASTAASDPNWGTTVVDRTVQLYANADAPLTSDELCALLMNSSGVAVRWSSDDCEGGVSPAGPLPTSTPPVGTQPKSCYVMVWAAKPADLNWLVHTTTITLTAQSVSFYGRVSDPCKYAP